MLIFKLSIFMICFIFILQLTNNMSCNFDSDCAFQYFCNINQLCQHYPVFPFRLYSAIIYFLIPFAISTCNLGGLSGGSFKIIIFMNLLNYPISEATSFIYVIIAGGALANLITLIPRKHPNGLTSLIDYNIVLIMFPGLLLGTTLGVILKTVLISLVQYIIVFVVLIFFWIIYFRKFLQVKHKLKSEQTKQIKEPIIESQIKSATLSSRDNLISSENQAEKYQSKFLIQQKGIHIKQIMITVIMFTMLTVTLSFAQGDIIHFQECSYIIWIGLAGYVLVVILTLLVIYKYTQNKMKIYKENQFIYNLKLDSAKIFLLIAVIGFGAGFLQGVMGLGSGFLINISLMYCKVPQTVISATSGFLIFFTGLSSFIQALLLHELQLYESLFFFFLTFIGSFTITQSVRKKLKNKRSFDAIIVLIMMFLLTLCITGIIINLIKIIKRFGFSELFDQPRVCI